MANSAPFGQSPGQGSGNSYTQASKPQPRPTGKPREPGYVPAGGELPFTPPNPAHGGTTIQPGAPGPAKSA